MAPFLTSRGKGALGVALVWLVLGGVLLVMGKTVAAWPMLMASSGVLLLLTASFFVAVPLGNVLESSLFNLELEPPGNAAALRTDQLVEADLELENQSGLAIRNLTFDPELSTALSCDTSTLPTVDLPAASRIAIKLPILARRSGRWFIHGLHLECLSLLGLFAVKSYQAAPVPMTFIPLGLLDRRMANIRPAAALHERIGVHEVKQRGFGTDLREIRDHQHGDPFKNIAWKATARTGKLMVREFESEIAINAYMLVDISSTMRGSVQQGGKLEHAIRLGTNFAQAVLRGNDRCGLMTFDEKIYGHIPPKDGPRQMTRLSQHLIGTSSMVDEALTEYDEDEVVEALVQYLILQRRLDFRRRNPRRKKKKVPEIEDLYDVELLNRWLRNELNDNPSPGGNRLRVGVLNYDELSLARRFCHQHGIEIPYRTELRYGTKELGLVQAVEVIMLESRNPHIILVISDLAGLVDTERVTRVLRLAMARRHKVAVLAPYTPDYVPRPNPGENPEGAILHELFSAAEARERRSVLKAMRKAGIRVVEVGPGERIGPLLKKLRLFT